MNIDTTEGLRELYGAPSGRASKKELSSLDKHAANFIRKSPFLVLSTCDLNGKMDASPRGGAPGFVHILNENQILIPDSKGNNRVDSLSNIVATGRVGMLFLIPGMDETLRLNGSAVVSSNPEFLTLFSEEKNPPKTCIVVSIEEVFLHCAKAFMRSKLWSEESKMERSEMPTMGQMLNEQIGSFEKVESQEDMVQRYQDDL